MNKKQKSSIILASLASIAVAGSLLAGSTYALFTSESKTNIAVTSGMVDVTATIEDLKTFSGKANSLTGVPEDDEINIVETDVAGTFTNGGTAVYENGTLTLDNMTPGDKVTFTIKVTNNSNVSAKYRTIISSDEGELFDGLEFKIGNKYGPSYSSWYTDETKTFDCYVKLPTDAKNEYQGKSCKIIFTVEAVQGNALVDEYFDTLEEAFDLEAGTFAYDTPREDSVELDGTSRKIFINNWVDGYANFDLTIKNVTFLNGLNISLKKDDLTITLEDCNVHACDQSKITATHKVNSGAGMCLNLEKCGKNNAVYVVKNCNFIGENDNTLPVYGNKYEADGTVSDSYKKRGFGIAFDAIAGGDGNPAVGSVKTALIEGCTIEGVRGNGIQLYGNTGVITIKDTNINSWGINSGNYVKTGETKPRYGDSNAIRGDYPSGGAKKLNLENVYIGLAEGAHGTGDQEIWLGHINVGSYAYNTVPNNEERDITEPKSAGYYNYTDN